MTIVVGFITRIVNIIACLIFCRRSPRFSLGHAPNSAIYKKLRWHFCFLKRQIMPRGSDVAKLKFFFKKMGHSRPLFRLFSSFSNILKNKSCRLSRIWTWIAGVYASTLNIWPPPRPEAKPKLLLSIQTCCCYDIGSRIKSYILYSPLCVLFVLIVSFKLRPFAVFDPSCFWWNFFRSRTLNPG